MRILILNQVFHPAHDATARYVADAAAFLVTRGHDVTVVCSRQTGEGGGVRDSRRESWRGVEILRVGQRATYLAACARRLLSLRRFDVVMATTASPALSWLGALFTRLKGGRFVSWALELGPERSVAQGLRRDDSLITRWLRALSNDGLRHSSLVIAPDPYIARRLAGRGVDRTMVEILPPWAHEDGVADDAGVRRALRRELGLEDKFVVLYVVESCDSRGSAGRGGSAGRNSRDAGDPFATLLPAARVLRKRSPILFCIVGGGDVPVVRDFVEQFRLENVRLLPASLAQRQAALLAAADLPVVAMTEAFLGVAHPGLVYDLRAADLPHLYIGPTPSPIADLGPPFAAAEGHVQAAVAQIELAAIRGPRPDRSLAVATTTAHGRDYLLSQLATSLERVGGAAVSGTLRLRTS